MACGDRDGERLQPGVDGGTRGIGSGVHRDGARAITCALLYVGAPIEAAAERQADDADTLAALLDDRLTSIEATIDTATAAPAPLWRRVTALLRRREAEGR
jgi:hypothetical protein